MEVALIPPYSELARIRNRMFQMILPSGLKDSRYRGAYFPPRMSGKFVILDNGMFEDDMFTTENLIELVDKWAPDELVMPDVRGDMESTLEAMDRFLNVFEQIHFDWTPTLMAVVQVDSAKQIPEFIQRAIDLEGVHVGNEGAFTFGIPRRLVETIGTFARVNVVDFLQEMVPDNAIHLLGYARNGCDPKEFNEFKELSDRVRSADTEAPFLWAYCGSYLTNPTPYERPGNWMNITNLPSALVKENISLIDRWAHGQA